jgi:hypothetical protein
MALIECPECEAQISDKAKTCPKCGCPVPEVEALSPAQEKAFEMLSKRVSVPMVAKATGLPMKEVSAMKAQLMVEVGKIEAKKEEQKAIWWDKVSLVICSAGLLYEITHKGSGFWMVVYIAVIVISLGSIINAAKKRR